MPILNLGQLNLQPGETIAERWKADLVAAWRKSWEANGRVASEKMAHMSWEESLQILSDRYKFNHEKGEVPEELAQKWYAGWDASRQATALKVAGSIPGFIYYGVWPLVFAAARGEYLDELVRKDMSTQVLVAENLSLLAERVAAKVNLDILGSILRNHGSKLTDEEKLFLNYYFADWKIRKSDNDNNRALSILSRIGFTHKSPDAIQEELHQVYLAAGGKEEDWMKIPSNTEQIISNGASRPITALDWNEVQGNQKVVTELQDGSYISPLNTMFLTQSAQAIDRNVENAVSSFKTQKVNPIAVAGVGFLLWTLFRR